MDSEYGSWTLANLREECQDFRQNERIDREVPAVTGESYHHYLAQFKTPHEEKVRHLYEEKFILPIRSTWDGNACFIKGRIPAEMRTKVVYVVDVMLDERGIVLEYFRKLAMTLIKSTEVKSAFLDHGRKYEQVGIRKYSEATRKNVKTCGLHVCQSNTYLAASPDGLTDDDVPIHT
ncbi:hypothetical protein Pcinc_022565 [Petrolisthes cinctipes]|uniref:YqaJ viral recombinase domain-containing protein n=1 Tax=Petrolisthes cinctipes TaxID=88211 RepID=A0AAE1KGY1_PETCI|nr:hypothetical protein Pcinc_022565 [Petrolisthes cinctipes]